MVILNAISYFKRILQLIPLTDLHIQRDTGI